MMISSSSLMLMLASMLTATTNAQQSILGGRYVTTNDVSGILALAQDAADMKEATDGTVKASIYSEGRHGKDGGASATKLSFADLSLNAPATMGKSPYYNIYRHGFLQIGNIDEGETEGDFDGNPASVYGDTIVNDLFDLDIENIETDAALVMNVWMAALHEVFTSARECKAGDVERATEHLDRSIAFWVGDGEVTGQNDRGHMLYNLAQKIGTRFGQDGATGETKVNTDIIDLYTTMQDDIVNKGSCAQPAYYLTFRNYVKKMVSLMTIPLAQNLIFHLTNIGNEDNSDLVELYALSLLPPVATCDPDAYRNELKHTVLKTTGPEDKDEAIASLQRAYTCLGITCADVGDYQGGVISQCTDPVGLNLVGYSSGTRDLARDKSFIDRDILQMGVFIKFEDMGSAVDWYEFGWHSEAHSLKDLADNDVIPEVDNSFFVSFQDYFEDDAFAEDFIMSVLLGTDADFVGASNNQKRLLVTAYLQYVVLFISSVTSLQSSIKECNNGKIDVALDELDASVAYYVGSIEGPEVTGSNQDAGSLLFGAAKDFCTEFGTCKAGGGNIPIAIANENVIAGFNAAATNLAAAKCDDVEDSIQTVFGRYMPVPLYQGVLRYASYNANLPPGLSDDGSLSLGFAFAQGILPIIDYADEDNALIIDRNMYFDNTNPVQDGFAAVAQAIRGSYDELDTLCGDIGVFKDEPADGDMCAVPDFPTQPPSAAPVQVTSAPAPEPTFAPIGDVHPTPATTADLAFGRYTFTDAANVENDAAFAMDVKAMFKAEDATAAAAVYTTGVSSAALSGAIGVTSLQTMSTFASQYMEKDALFNIFKYALYDDEDLSDTSGEDFTYADDVVMEALNDAEDPKLGAESSVVLNVWMVIANRLYSAVRLCEEGVDARPFIDSAVALWIGKEQAEGKYDHGWMMYSIGQSGAKYFGLPEGEAPVNTQLMVMFNEAQQLASACTAANAEAADEKDMKKLRRKTDEILQKMTLPLVQSLLFHMIENNRNMVELYGVATAPHSIACDEDAFERLTNVTYYDYDRSTSLTPQVKNDLGDFLRCYRITCDDLKTTNKANKGLQNLVKNLCKHLDTDEPPTLAGYTPTNNIIEESRIDLDIAQMQIFMTTKAYEEAYDLYYYGRNSLKEDGSVRALQELATSSNRNLVQLFATFKKYQGGEKFANTQIEDAIYQDEIYANAGRHQLQQIVERTLQTSVMYMTVFWHLQVALNMCNDGKLAEASKSWDQAVAYYTGSIEGPLAGGKEGGDGHSLFSLANEFCEEFDTCASNDGSDLNSDLLKYFKTGQDAIADSHCKKVERTMTWDVLPTATLPLIQATLYYAIVNDDPNLTGEEASIAAGSAIAYAVGPLVSAANETSGATIKRNFDFTKPPMPDGAAKVFEAMTYSLRGMGLDCKDVGKPMSRPDLDPCTVAIDEDNDGVAEATVAPIAPHQDTQTNLGDGLYVTTTYVDDRASIALDIKGMEGGLNQKEISLAKVIYESGENSEVYDENGKFKSLRSFQKMSTEETQHMDFMPLFNVFKYALQDSNGMFEGRDVRLYADTLVEETFTVASQSADITYLPAEAAVALNLWMHLAYTLERTLLLCESKMIRGEDGISAMDEAVAYWVGDGQIAGNSERGHLLYALTEKMGETFSTEDAGQARANINILKLFNAAKNDLSLPNACANSPTTYVQLRAKIYDIISQMSVPLIQGLIDSLRLNDRPRVKVYAHAIIPMVAQCDPVTFEYLKDKLMGMTYNVVEVDDIVQSIRSVYTCLGLQCSDIGVHTTEKDSLQDENGLQCVDPNVRTKLAGYTPTTDVREYASLDLDVLQLDILLKMKAYSAAMEVYTFGKNVRQESAAGGSLSLFQLATTSERSIVPEYDAFNRYFNGDDYADKIIRDAFQSSSDEMSDAEKHVTILRSSQVLIMYFAILQSINEAVDECETVISARAVEVSNAPGVNTAWDRAAALLIGSLEGTETGGSKNGYMFYDIAQSHCVEFGTCKDESKDSVVNDEIITLLFAGRGAVITNNCDALRKTAKELSSLALVPMIQSTLSAALKLTKDDSAQNRAEAAIYAKSLMPLVENADRDAAKALSDNLLPPGPSKKNKIASEVFAALSKVYGDLGVDCNLIGDAGGYDACSGSGGSDGPDLTILWIVLGVLAGLIIGFFLFRCCRRKEEEKKTLPENNPTFVTADGELNHSMDLLTKAFSSNPRAPAERDEMEGLNDASPSLDDDFEESPALGSKGSGSDII